VRVVVPFVNAEHHSEIALGSTAICTNSDACRVMGANEGPFVRAAARLANERRHGCEYSRRDVAQTYPVKHIYRNFSLLDRLICNQVT
jgi:hypothetical protein